MLNRCDGVQALIVLEQAGQQLRIVIAYQLTQSTRYAVALKGERPPNEILQIRVTGQNNPRLAHVINQIAQDVNRSA